MGLLILILIVVLIQFFINENRRNKRQRNAETLVELKKLLDEGVISEEEFEIKKKELL